MYVSPSIWLIIANILLGAGVLFIIGWIGWKMTQDIASRAGEWWLLRVAGRDLRIFLTKIGITMADGGAEVRKKRKQPPPPPPQP